eukprot:1148207-Pelagomonas_calceolata.AAC.3
MAIKSHLSQHRLAGGDLSTQGSHKSQHSQAAVGLLRQGAGKSKTAEESLRSLRSFNRYEYKNKSHIGAISPQRGGWQWSVFLRNPYQEAALIQSLPLNSSKKARQNSDHAENYSRGIPPTHQRLQVGMR